MQKSLRLIWKQTSAIRFAIRGAVAVVACSAIMVLIFRFLVLAKKVGEAFTLFLFEIKERFKFPKEKVKVVGRNGIGYFL
jgi:hypothetical protein